MTENVTSNDREVAGMVTARAALDAKTRGDELESRLRKAPFWRFLRRRRLGQGLAVARAMERSAIAAMGGKQSRRR
jgi:hypothetical protein